MKQHASSFIEYHRGFVKVLTVLAFSLAATVGTTAFAQVRIVHAYDGELQPRDRLVCVRVLKPITIFFVDDVPVKVSSGEILALLPDGKHSLIGGCPIKQSGTDLASKISSGMSNNKEVVVDGRAGSFYQLGGQSSAGTTMTINGVPMKLPPVLDLQLKHVSDQAATVDSLLSDISGAQVVRTSLASAFLSDPGNAQDYALLQGRWRVVASNINGEVITIQEYKKRARARGGNVTLLDDIALEVEGVRTKWVGEGVTGDGIIVDMDASRLPKLIRTVTVGDGESQQAAIYEIQGDTLKYCFGSSVPQSFAVGPGDGRLSFVLRKETKEQALKRTASATRKAVQPSRNPGAQTCFIATAAYGSSWDDHVLALRHFRERYLLTHASGREFVAFYYRVSPAIAELIAGHGWARSLVRAGLWPIVLLAKASLGDIGAIWTLLLASGAGVMLGCSFLKYRRWHRRCQWNAQC